MDKMTHGKVMPPVALPVCLLGANVLGKPNYCTIAWFTMIDDEPPTIGLFTGKDRRTVDGIRENGTFGVSVPSAEQVVAVDYVGITSGREADKSEVFPTFYGKLGNAPMARDCPLTMECELKQILEFGGTDLMVGEIAEVYTDEGAYRDGRPDAAELDPLLYLSTAATYHRLGEKVADAFKVGRSYSGKK
ncbi:MAG: flavin reductase family protein [Methanomassiliicoccus sp.]|nr:flavin reductase family protein [Methanomassiliicoccus sp.]